MSLHLGIIGGMGTEAGLATAQIICDTFKIIRKPYPKLTLISDETTPDRSAFLLGKNNQNPAGKISLIGDQLLSLGVDHIIIACFTAHSPAIIDRIDPRVSAKLISLFSPLRILLQTNQRVGVLATNGSQRSGVFDYNLPACQIVYPKDSDQQTLMKSIYDIKRNGINQASNAIINQITSRLSKQSDVVVIGCTELLLVRFRSDLRVINPIKSLGKQLANTSRIFPKKHLTLTPALGL